jgi:hypothetical protein
VGLAAGGLGWDALLHAHDPLLAQHETVFSTSNPAHVLIAGGIFAALAGQAAITCLRLSGAARSAFGIVASFFALAVGASSAWSWHVEADNARAQALEAQLFVAQTRAAISRYRDVAVAMADGYEPVTPLNGPIVEWMNPAYEAAHRIVDISRPERLMYIGGGRREVLAGAMFVMPDPNQAGPRIAGGLAHWHRHLDLCYLPNGTIAGTNAFGLACPSGSVARPSPAMLHVWIVPNPQGPFADDLSPAAAAAVLN